MYIRMYIYWMTRRYSIAEARKNLAEIIDKAESGAEVELTRRGRPIAVLLSVEEFSRLQGKRRSFAEAYREFRKRFPEGEDGVEPEYFEGLRDRSYGRTVDL